LSKLPKNELSMPSATLWLLDGSLVHEHDVAFFAQQLGVCEAHRYGGFGRRERKRQFLLGRMLLRFAVAHLMSLSPDTLGVVERDGQAPQLVLPELQCMPPAFSISHSRDWVACAVSLDAILGFDIEVNDPTRDIVGIGNIAFHANEHFWLLQQSEAMRLSAFYQLWCTKEALHKLASNLGRETVLSPLVGVGGTLESQGSDWHRYTLSHFGLSIVLCSDRPLSALRKIELAGLSRADWLAPDRKFRSTSAARLPREASK
jgi:4'-phosphopantetheinyl transferase